MEQALGLMQAVGDTPVPNLLIGAGILFLFIAVVGQFAWQIRVSRKQQLAAGVLGLVLLLAGMALYLVPSAPAATAGTPAGLLPAATAEARGVVVFEDGFSSNIHEWSLGQDSDDYGTTSTALLDGRLRRSMTSTRSVLWQWNLPGVSVRDFWFSLEATVVDAPGDADDASISLIYRKGEDDYYRVRMNCSGAFIVNLNQDGEWKTLVDWRRDGATRLEKGVAHQLAVQAQGSQFAFYANGELLATWVDEGVPAEGKVAIGMGLDKAGGRLTVDFDNITVKEIR